MEIKKLTEELQQLLEEDVTLSNLSNPEIVSAIQGKYGTEDYWEMGPEIKSNVIKAVKMLSEAGFEVTHYDSDGSKDFISTVVLDAESSTVQARITIYKTKRPDMEIELATRKINGDKLDETISGLTALQELTKQYA